MESVHLNLLEYKVSSSSEPVKMKVYDKSKANWRTIAGLLGLGHGDIQGIHRRSGDDRECVEAVFDHWLKNANCLPNKRKYPKKWSGLIRLLNDAELGELAGDLEKSLTAPFSDVRDNL